MTHAVDAVDAAAIALGERTWIPHDEERALGQAFLGHRDAVGPRLLPGMPPHSDPQGWVTQHVLWLEDVSALAAGVRDQWYGYLPTSHMTALVSAYAEQAAAVLPLADHLRERWHAEPPELLTEEQVTWWEEWHLPPAQRQQLDAVTHRLVVIGSVVVAAVTGAWHND
ncbi:hypothetical protein M1P56_11955 [Streptomyces sp. HU2014]|uniref:hypothetical protein n=1 Tax=Streptomyces sp. HU2014 TaxID=2939414 RepID=UPI00200BBA50|nr:hypothetical protein [Streptomyces sp. HU2014]UQI45015.1 hypothetical protein M1P56_11955 [Streptomyces sp. HU2014]